MRKHPILRAIPGFRPLIKRAERVEREQIKLQQRIAKLEEKLQKKNEVVAELMEEHLVLKKSFGEI